MGAECQIRKETRTFSPKMPFYSRDLTEIVDFDYKKELSPGTLQKRFRDRLQVQMKREDK